MELQTLYEYHQNGHKNLYQLYQKFSKEEIEYLLEQLIEEGITETEQEDILLHIALYSNACGKYLPEWLYKYLFERRIFSIPEVFIRAEEKVADWVIALLEQWDRKEESSYYANHLLLGVLIYIPCERVARFLKQSSVEPLPLWTQNLNLLPIEFTQFAGWTVKEDGQIKKLYEDEVTVWSVCDKKDASQEIPLCNLKTKCPSCGERFSLIYRGKRNYVTCLECACYDTVFIRQKAERIFWMGNGNSDDEEEMEIILEEDTEDILELDYGFSISNEKRLPVFTMSEWPDISHSQMGGLPTPRGSEVYYPNCRLCGKKMRFKVQLDMNELNAWEGIYYFFICEECGITACNYNQT